MARIQSSDGSSKTVGVISKTPYVRPNHPKIMCQQCNERPDGFRGTHELDRHVARAHAPVRKGYVCVAPAFDKAFLDNCKHCRNKKVYGAYYNAAAHLRRAHFHPRKRGRKGKNDEKRGGIGGGDHPAMEWLKTHWIQETEVPNAAGAASPDSASDSAPETEMESRFAPQLQHAYAQPRDFDTALDAAVAPAKSFPLGQRGLPSLPLDYGLSAGIQAAGPVLFDDAFSFAQADAFTFDAYAMQQ